jgi:acetyl esterase/lipase
MALAGHSRGGKLAALIAYYVAVREQGFESISIKATYLLDPVDLLPPSAVAALEGLQPRLALGVTGVGVTTAFNPVAVNYTVSLQCRPATYSAEASTAAIATLLTTLLTTTCSGGEE